jgi:hypothetical protein
MWKSIRNLRDLEKDDVLEMLNLQSRRGAADYILPTIGVFSLGVLVGAGIGLLLAPKSGRELRDDLRTKLESGRDQLPGLSSATGAANERAPRGI